MLLAVPCACGRQLQALEEDAGKSVPCPFCGHQLVVPPKPESSPAETGPLNAATALASQTAIHYTDEVPHLFATKAEAKDNYRKCKHELPEVESAYKPSGRCPRPALYGMSIGSVLSVPGATLAGLVSVFVAPLLAWLVLGLLLYGADKVGLRKEWLREGWPRDVLRGAVVYVAFLLTFLVIGLGPGWLVGSVAKRTKARNPDVAGLFAMAAAVLAALAAGWLLAQFRPDLRLPRIFLFEESARAAAGVFGSGAWPWFHTGLAVVLAGFAAACLAYYLVSEQKFCEHCEKPMEWDRLVRFRLGGARLLKAALGQGDFTAAAAVFEVATGRDCRPLLFSCPKCDRGYVELKMEFATHWGEAKEKDKPSMEESWLIVSHAVPAEVTVDLRKHLDRKV